MGTPRWFKNHVAYTMAKYGMSMCVLGMAEEFKKDGIAVNAIWPRTAIYTAAMEMLGGGKDVAAGCRSPEIMADAAYVILNRDSKTFTGNFCVDDAILREEGMTDFKQYLASPSTKESDLIPDFFLDDFKDSVHQDLVERQTIDAQKKSDKPAAAAATSSSTSSSGGSGSIQAVFDKIQGYITEDVVKKTNAVFAFKITDDDSDWFLDLKNGSGSCGPGATKADVTFSVSTDNFGKMFSGKLKPTTAFMTGKLKISGNMGKAMALEKLMSKMK